MKKAFRYILFPALIALAFCSCSKDIGNYDYNDANVITITTDMANVDPAVVINNDSLVVKQNDSLKINLLINQTKPSNDLAYEWMIIQNSNNVGNPIQYVVGNTAQLRTKIILSPNLYQLVVKVTDKTTGVSFYKFYALNVDTAPWGGEGWVVLQEQAGQGGDVSVITTRDGVVRGTIYSNVYSLANNGNKLPAGTYKVNVMNYSTAMRVQKVSFLYPNGGLQVRSTDYMDSSRSNEWFVNLPSVINMETNSVVPVNGQHEMMINNGQLHYQLVNPTSIKAPPILFSAPLIGSWPALSKYFMPSANGLYCTFFDKVNRCFLHINLQNNTLLPATQPDAANQHWAPYSGAGGAATAYLPTGKGYDLNNIGRNLIYSENAQLTDGAANPVYYNIFRNPANDSTWVYQFTSGTTGVGNANVTGRYFLKDAATNVPGINTASIFAVPAFTAGGVSNAFYYVPGNSSNTINVCNPSYTGTMPATTTAHLGYSFPTGTIIKTMKVFKSGYLATSLPSTESRVLVVATDETAGGGGNKVYFFNLTPTGEINATPANVYTGFDKIVDIAFKKGLGY